MVKNDKFSNELNRLLTFMEEEVERELPSPTLGVEYFILAVLEQKDSFVYDRIDGLLPSLSLDAMEDSYRKYLSSKALAIMKPGREVKYNEKLTAALEGADAEREKLKAEKITSEHVLLYILNDNSEDNKIRKVFNKAGLTYSMLFEKITTDEPYEDAENRTENGEDKFQGIKIDGNRVRIAVPEGEDPTELIKSLLNGEMPAGAAGKRRKSKGGNGNSYPNIESYCTNLNDLVAKGKIDKLVGRGNEIDQIVRILGRRRKNNCVLVGGEGVGKTAIGENLAYRIIEETVPDFLLNKKVISLDMTALMAGTTLRGMFEERVKGILDEIKEDGNFILFIDNIGNVLADKGKNDYDISAMLSHALENGEVQVVGTSDFASYRSVFDKDASLGRRFQKIIVEAPTIEESTEILNGLKPYYEEFHSVKYTDKAVTACVNLANRYITERNLPDSALDVMDEAGSLIGTSASSNEEIKNLKANLKDIRERIAKCKAEDNYEEADKLEQTERQMTIDLNETKKAYEKSRKENPIEIDEDVILNIISSKTGIPVNKLSADDKKKLATINDRLKEEVIGQDEAIDTICKSLKRNRVGLSDGKCMFSCMAIGKTGVGKTLIAKKLAKEMFGDEKALIRFDMSEYPDKTAVNKLIGSNPGYVGYEEGGQLTEAIKNKKHCVLLLDEIEKADPEVYNIFLQVLDEGFLTDNSGMKVDFKNVIIIFTSNVGAKNAAAFSKGIGWREDVDANSKKILLKELKNKFPPEFLNRLNSVIYFNSLTDDNMKDIIKLEIKKLEKRLGNLGYKMKYDDASLEFLLNIVKDEKEFGARPVMRAIQENIEDKITDLLLENTFEEGYEFNISCFSDSNEITVA